MVGAKTFYKKVKEHLPEMLQPVWWPVTSETLPLTLGRPAALASKFGRVSPWTPPGDENWKWPRCEECQEPKTFFCQIYIKVTKLFLQDRRTPHDFDASGLVSYQSFCGD